MTDRYALLDGPLPVAGYLGRLWVRDQKHGCVVEWPSTMTIATADAAPVAEALKAVYADGLAGLDALVSGRPT